MRQTSSSTSTSYPWRTRLRKRWSAGFILLGAVILLLAIAAECRQSAHRPHRRAATGARRTRGVRRRAGRDRAAAVTENLVLAPAGTARPGHAYWTTQVMLALGPGSMPRADEHRSTGACFRSPHSSRSQPGPVWRRRSLCGAVVTTGRSAARTPISVRPAACDIAIRRLLPATEVALSLMLFIGAALLTRSFIALQNVRFGFDPSKVITAGIGIPVAGPFRPAQDGLI